MAKQRLRAITLSASQLYDWFRRMPSARLHTDEIDTLYKRVQAGSRAIFYGARRPGADEPEEQNLSDTLANILHFCDAYNASCGPSERIDFDNALRLARGHYEAERKGEV